VLKEAKLLKCFKYSSPSISGGVVHTSIYLRWARVTGASGRQRSAFQIAMNEFSEMFFLFLVSGGFFNQNDWKCTIQNEQRNCSRPLCSIAILHPCVCAGCGPRWRNTHTCIYRLIPLCLLYTPTDTKCLRSLTVTAVTTRSLLHFTGLFAHASIYVPCQ
jgi:hypothetical protein